MNVYETKEMGALLASNRYPGRGIVLGLTPDGKESVAAYFIPTASAPRHTIPPRWRTPASLYTTLSASWAGR